MASIGDGKIYVPALRSTRVSTAAEPTCRALDFVVFTPHFAARGCRVKVTLEPYRRCERERACTATVVLIKRPNARNKWLVQPRFCRLNMDAGCMHGQRKEGHAAQRVVGTD